MNDVDRHQVDLLRAEMNGRFNEIVGKLDVIDTKAETAAKTGDDHEVRLRSVERWKNALPVATLLFIATSIMGLIKVVGR